MEILSTVLLVFFVIVAILLVLLVLVQSEEGDSLGGIFAGGSGSAFGSRSGNVLTRSTTVLGSLFLIISLGLALLNRTPGGTGVEAAGRELSSEAAASNWLEEELNPKADFSLEDVFIQDNEIIFNGADSDGPNAEEILNAGAAE
ncbi:MAG: preprotein translocase subunit SecG [Treponema sp.]|jgi:preprotein translocase subunit SecG|nr:preprotein translocase subunit SecG [Treponema sp.]